MAGKSRSGVVVDRPRQPVVATVLGSTRLAPGTREAVLHADPAPLHAVATDAGAEVALAQVEDLLGRGQFGAALRTLKEATPTDPALATRYAFVRQEKMGRAVIGVAERYRARGDEKNARTFYGQALTGDAGHPEAARVASLAVKAFDDLHARRAKLIDGLLAAVRKKDFTGWCGQKRALDGLTILDVASVRAQIYPDFRLEAAFGERSPVTAAGYLDPLPVESDLVAFSSPVPGSIFRAATEAAVDVDAPQTGVPGEPPGDRVHASLAFPVMANVLAAKLGLLALDARLSIAGEAEGTLPLYRYEYLRDAARRLVADVQAIETRMLPIQFTLDDFAETVSVVRRPLGAAQAELAAVRQKIGELTQVLGQLTQVEQALEPIVVAFDQAADDCDCDWYCWLVSLLSTAFIIVVGVVLTFVAISAVAASGGLAAIIIAETIMVLGITLTSVAGAFVFTITHDSFTCDYIAGTVGRLHTTLNGVRASLVDTTAELQHALARRDVLIAQINALSQQLDAIYQSNAARLLDARTLDAIQAQYNSLRRSLLSRAQAVAQLAQSAFNFERDSDTRLIRDAYFESGPKGYTAAETLLHDLGGLDHIDLTGRTQKPLQLSQMVSLRKHAPVSFVALAATRGARFTTAIADFDRWYPGTYLQRIKEVRVEVLVDGEIVPARGYLSNDGVSLVRFVDSADSRPIDKVHVFPEPDPDIAKLCYKRLQRRRHVDTMAFPAFSSDLYDARQRDLQARERNPFEDVGLESSWTIEFLPDQPFDLAKISDVRVWFQYEAQFDDNLRRLLESKRYAGRREMATIAVLALVRDRDGAADPSQALAFTTARDMFEGPALDKTIANAGVALRLKGGKVPGGPAAIEVGLNGAVPIMVTTTDEGVAATADEHPAGGGLAELAAMVHGKSVAGSWTLRIASLPAGVVPADVDELFLLLNCEYAV